MDFNAIDGIDIMPTLIAFDLDYTLWSGWIDTHYTAPLRRPTPNALNQLLDKNDKRLSLYPSVSRILHKLQQSQTHVAAVSRTDTPDLTRDALAMLLVPPPKERPRERPQRAIDFFESLEIYPESKRVHFSELHKKTSIPYSTMLFFAGDTSEFPSNSEVQQLGVTFIPVDPKRGITEAVVDEGVREWRRRRRARATIRGRSAWRGINVLESAGAHAGEEEDDEEDSESRSGSGSDVSGSTW